MKRYVMVGLFIEGSDSMLDKEKLQIINNETVKAVLSVSDKVTKIILFGSQARGDSEEGSDIDILVVTDVSEEQLSKIKRDMRHYADDICLEYDEVVSLIISTKIEYDTMQHMLFYKNVARDGIVLYNKEC